MDVVYAAALFPNPNASASSAYDFFRASWSYTAVMIISSSALLAAIIGCSFCITVAGLPTNSRERLRAIAGVQCATPGGAFYAYPNIATTYQRGIESSMDFAVKLLETEHVAVVPGSAFGTRDHIRISYATSMELLDTGLTRIARFMESL